MSLRDSLATPEEKARYVRGLFATIADRYDLITVLLSYGRDRAWKRRLVRMAGALRGLEALDLACGTGDIAYLLSAAGASVTALDLTPRMIDLAVARPPAAGQPRPRFLVGDMEALPFDRGRFDVVTTGYGLRNVAHLRRAVSEASRVLRPGGLLLSLDFNRPSSAPVRAAYHGYLSLVGSAVGWVLHGDPDTYRYIPESIRRYPGADAVVGLMTEEGFVDARWHRVLFGLLAIHSARRK